MNRLLLTLPLLLVQGFLTVTLAQPHRVIFDTEFKGHFRRRMMHLALLLALNSPEIEVLGITTVAGNKSREQATADALKVLEGVGCEETPVYPGANMPLIHEVSEFSFKQHGEWWKDGPPDPPLGELARNKT